MEKSIDLSFTCFSHINREVNVIDFSMSWFHRSRFHRSNCHQIMHWEHQTNFQFGCCYKFFHSGWISVELKNSCYHAQSSVWTLGKSHCLSKIWLISASFNTKTRLSNSIQEFWPISANVPRTLSRCCRAGFLENFHSLCDERLVAVKLLQITFSTVHAE